MTFTRSALILSCALCASSLHAQLTWANQRVEIMDPPVGVTALNATYAFENKTGETIVILDTHASCGCTTPALEKKVYAPGEKGELKVSYAPGSRQGMQTNSITVSTSAGDVFLQLVVNLPQRLQIEPRLVIFNPGEHAPRSIKLSFRVDVPVSEVRLGDPGPDFTAKLAAEKEGADYTLTVTSVLGKTEAAATLFLHSKGASGVTYTDTVFFRRAASEGSVKSEK